ncbi:hypothetical protein FKM82_024058, partial [Ascaphus truei]
LSSSLLLPLPFPLSSHLLFCPSSDPPVGGEDSFDSWRFVLCLWYWAPCRGFPGWTVRAGAQDHVQDMEFPGSLHRDGLHYFIQEPDSGRLYKRGKLIGKGAFGRCYKFTDTSSNHVYAVKISQTRKAHLQHRGGVSAETLAHFFTMRHLVGECFMTRG